MRSLTRAALAAVVVAGLGASLALAASPERATYAGITDQDKAITLRLKNDARGVRYEISYRMPCDTADPAESTAFSTRGDRIRPDADGRFGASFEQADTLSDGTPYLLTSDLTGKLGKRRASGTYRGTLTYTTPGTGQTVNCDSGTVGWTAKRR